MRQSYFRVPISLAVLIRLSMFLSFLSRLFVYLLSYLATCQPTNLPTYPAV